MDIARTPPRRGGTAADQQIRAIATCDALVAAARALFTEQGYSATGTPDLVARAAVTRGALYHHFPGKEALFEAVFRQVLADLNNAARAQVAVFAGDVWGQVTNSFTAYLDLIAANPEFQRILLIDGPAVLGWRRWREIHGEHVAAGTEAAFKVLMRQGHIPQQPPGPLANLVQAALNDAALTIAHAPDPRAASIEAGNAFIFLLEGLNSRSRAQPLQAQPATKRI